MIVIRMEKCMGLLCDLSQRVEGVNPNGHSLAGELRSR